MAHLRRCVGPGGGAGRAVEVWFRGAPCGWHPARWLRTVERGRRRGWYVVEAVRRGRVRRLRVRPDDVREVNLGRASGPPATTEEAMAMKKAKVTKAKDAKPKEAKPKDEAARVRRQVEAAARMQQREKPQELRAAATPATTGGLAAAARVLAEAGGALGCREIARRALEGGLWATKGRTPHATLYAGIIREIAAKGPTARFARGPEKGTFVAAKGGA